MRWTLGAPARDGRAMTDRLHVLLQRCDSSQNMARFYVLSLSETLFGDVALRRAWGRIGGQGRQRLDLYENEGLAIQALDDWLQRKLRKGYVMSPPLSATKPADAG
jgi:predicted DNA-binding WGR domain protein